ncbi:MAG: aminotransferase class III-fold pyridoxal phosphate-dependent enzyme, partial [Bdellovibrionota bacterium]
MNQAVLKRFPNAAPRPKVTRGEGCYLFLEDGRKLLDATSGWCALHVLGYNHPQVIEAMRDQMSKYCHLDINQWDNPQVEELAELLLSRAPKGLDKVYFSGTGGSESVEAAMKMSYQHHYNQGKSGKQFFISRDLSFHGSTLLTMGLSTLDIFDIYSPLFADIYKKIPLHYPLWERRFDESLDDYARRGALDLEKKILELGPDHVAAFVGETILGGLLGDVPPAPNYWKYIREVCDRYDVHLILDEVYCGLGRSGKIYCCDWDEITPDFICVAKGLGGGHAPLSAVITQSKIETSVKAAQGRVHGGHTYQGYSLGCAAGLAIQKIVQRDEML